MLNKEIYLIVLVKFLKNILKLLTGLQFDICYVINTRVEFEIAEVTRFLNYFRAIHLLFKIVIKLKILEILRSTSIVKLFVYKTVKCEVIKSNFSAEIFLWTILQLQLNENVWNYYSSKGMSRIDSQFLKIYTFEIFNSWNTLYLFHYIQLVFYSFTHT